MAISYLSLGSNIGDRQEFLTKATTLLNEFPHTTIMKKSSIYETKAWGLKDQDDFLNIVLVIESTLSPYELLEFCQSIEKNLDRKRLIHWGPRTIDIDILIYDELHINEQDLTIPHPFILDRPFVTIPLAEVAPRLVVNNCNILEIAKQHELLNECINF